PRRLRLVDSERLVEHLALERDAVDRPGALEADKPGEHVLAHELGRAPPRGAVAAAAREPVAEQLAGRELDLGDRIQRLDAAARTDEVRLARRGLAAALPPPGRYPARALGAPVAGPVVGDRLLRLHNEPLADVRRRDRARVREARDADDAVLAQLDGDAPERARVVRDVRVDRVEEPGHAVVHRAGAR